MKDYNHPINLIFSLHHMMICIDVHVQDLSALCMQIVIIQCQIINVYICVIQTLPSETILGAIFTGRM